MFCTKCGFNAQDSKFCPKCGTPISGIGVQPAQQVQPEQPVQQQYVQQPVPPKKKKWPKVLAIVAAVLIILSAGGYFAYPYITEMLSPKKQAVTALKNAGADFQTMVTDSISSLATTQTAANNELKGSIKLGNATVDGMNYMSYLKVDTINYQIQTDISADTVSGTIGLASGSSANVINIQFYTDAYNVYFKIPELFTESFKMSVSDLGLSTSSSVSGSIGSLSSVLGSVDAATISQYSDVIEAVIKDVMTGFDRMIDKCVYNNTGSSTYQSENGEIKVSTFDVTLTKDALIEGVNAAIDAMYADSAVSSYMSLMTTLTGGNKDTIKTQVQQALSVMPDIPFTLYVNNKSELVKVSVNMSAIDSTVAGEFSVEFIGKDKPAEYVVIQANADGTSVKYTVKSSDNSASIALDIIPDQTSYKGEFLSVGADITMSGSNMVLDNLFCKGNFDDYTIDVSASGQMNTSTYGSMSLTASSFRNSINPKNMTTAQNAALSEELLKNMGVIKKVISDSLFNQLFLGSSF